MTCNSFINLGAHEKCFYFSESRSGRTRDGEYLHTANARIEKTDGVSINGRGACGVRTIILIGIAFYVTRVYVFRHVRIASFNDR